MKLSCRFFLLFGALTLALVPSRSAPAAEPARPDPLPGLRRLMDTPLRDTSICRGPEGLWYLTGTVEPFWAYNEGIKVWRSPDLTKQHDFPG